MKQAPESAWLKEIDESWTLFLDRDGVINERKKPGYILEISEFILLPGVVEGLVELRKIFG
ncbi:MAG: HAD family hydrolase, partial [Bacteroidota bacterium]